MEPFSLMTPQDHQFTPKTQENGQEVAYVAVNPLPIESEEHTPPFSGEIIVLSTPSSPKL